MRGFYGFVIGIIYNKSTKTLHYHSFITYRLIYTYISSLSFWTDGPRATKCCFNFVHDCVTGTHSRDKNSLLVVELLLLPN